MTLIDKILICNSSMWETIFLLINRSDEWWGCIKTVMSISAQFLTFIFRAVGIYEQALAVFLVFGVFTHVSSTIFESVRIIIDILDSIRLNWKNTKYHTNYTFISFKTKCGLLWNVLKLLTNNKINANLKTLYNFLYLWQLKVLKDTKAVYFSQW